MDISSIEQAIITRLAPLRDSGLMVRALPNRSSEIGKIEGNGAITVSWSLDESRTPASMGLFTQDCLMSWMLDIRLRTLRDDSGAWVVRSAIYGLLVGFQPPHCKKMYAKRFEFVERSEATWVFLAEFIAPTVLVETPIASIPGTLLKEIFAAETVNQVVISQQYPIVANPPT